MLSPHFYFGRYLKTNHMRFVWQMDENKFSSYLEIVISVVAVGCHLLSPLLQPNKIKTIVSLIPSNI